MNGEKNISLRLTAEEYYAFDAICREKGYSKTGKIREFIRKLIKEELDSTILSEQEWKRVEEGIREIEKGEYITFDQLQREIQNRHVADNKNIKYSKGEHPGAPRKGTKKNP